MVFSYFRTFTWKKSWFHGVLIRFTVLDSPLMEGVLNVIKNDYLSAINQSTIPAVHLAWWVVIVVYGVHSWVRPLITFLLQHPTSYLESNREEASSSVPRWVFRVLHLKCNNLKPTFSLEYHCSYCPHLPRICEYYRPLYYIYSCQHCRSSVVDLITEVGTRCQTVGAI